MGVFENEHEAIEKKKHLIFDLSAFLMFLFNRKKIKCLFFSHSFFEISPNFCEQYSFYRRYG